MSFLGSSSHIASDMVNSGVLREAGWEAGPQGKEKTEENTSSVTNTPSGSPSKLDHMPVSGTWSSPVSVVNNYLKGFHQFISLKKSLITYSQHWKWGQAARTAAADLQLSCSAKNTPVSLTFSAPSTFSPVFPRYSWHTTPY